MSLCSSAGWGFISVSLGSTISGGIFVVASLVGDYIFVFGHFLKKYNTFDGISLLKIFAHGSFFLL